MPEIDGIGNAQAYSRTGEAVQRYAHSVAPDLDRIHGNSAPFADAATSDSFQNFLLRLGAGSGNEVFDGSTYGFNPITRVRTLLEFVHRGSWLGGVAVDLVADDMTKLGIEITSNFEEEEDEQELHNEIQRRQVWQALNDCIKWARLYGGCIGVLQIDGQDWEAPLDPNRIQPESFKGILPLDRWMVEPQFGAGQVITELGPDLGLPKYYKITGFAPVRQGSRVHYSRCLRFEGIRLPYWQRVMEQMWGISVLERLYDRMVAFDSATMGAAQLVQKSHLRTYKYKGLRNTLAAGGDAAAMLVRYVDMMRRFQGIEGVTLIDSEDDFAIETRSGFAGIPEALVQFGQQLAGALQIPLVRLFGMSPAGFSATGESDMRTYYDGINQRQENEIRRWVNLIYQIAAASRRIRLGTDFKFIFKSLWQMTDEAKAGVAATTSTSIVQAYGDGVITRANALSEMRQLSRKTGMWSTITPEDVEQAEAEPPPGFGEMGMPGQEPGMPGQPGEQPLAEEPRQLTKQPAAAGGEPAREEAAEQRVPTTPAALERGDASSSPAREEDAATTPRRGRHMVHLHLVRDDLERLTEAEVKGWLEARGYSVQPTSPAA